MSIICNQHLKPSKKITKTLLIRRKKHFFLKCDGRDFRLIRKFPKKGFEFVQKRHNATYYQEKEPFKLKMESNVISYFLLQNIIASYEPFKNLI